MAGRDQGSLWTRRVFWGLQSSSRQSPSLRPLVSTHWTSPAPPAHLFLPRAGVWNCQCFSVLFGVVLGDRVEQPLSLQTCEVPCAQLSRELQVDCQLLTRVVSEGVCPASSWEGPCGAGQCQPGVGGVWQLHTGGLKEAGAFVVCGFHSGNPGHRQVK